MPSLSEVQDAAFGQFVDNFPVLQPDVGIAFDGVPFEEPTDTAWVKLTLLPGDEYAASIPARRRRQHGEFVVQVFSPAGMGADPALLIADSVLEVMRGVTVASVRFRGLRRPERLGTEGRWFQVNVSMPFETDTIT